MEVEVVDVEVVDVEDVVHVPPHEAQLLQF
jgi:hypothetical protein